MVDTNANCKDDKMKKFFSILNISKFRNYNSGKYIMHMEIPLMSFLNKVIEYLLGVTIARQKINRLKPAFIKQLQGDVVEIGGYDNYFKKRYKRGRILNLDIKKGKCIDIVANAENMSMIEDCSISGVICISVLEHTFYPQKIIDEIYRILKPGGKVFLSIPWMFETHMEPNDYFRLSSYILEDWVKEFNIVFRDFKLSPYNCVKRFSEK